MQWAEAETPLNPYRISCRVDDLSDSMAELGNFPGTPGNWGGGGLSHLSTAEAALARPDADGGEGSRESRRAPRGLVLFVPVARALGFDKTLLSGNPGD